MARAAKFEVPKNWSFDSPEVVKAFDSHVREQLPWYELATGIVAHVARCYVPDGGIVIDVGASTGNIGRALAPLIKARKAGFYPIDASPAMQSAYDGPGELEITDAFGYDYESRQPDLIVCFLSLMFVPTGRRTQLIARMKAALDVGGALVIFDKMVPHPGYAGTVAYSLTLAAKADAGADFSEIVAKELSIAGLQRPFRVEELTGFVEIFRFGNFAGYVFEKV